MVEDFARNFDSAKARSMARYARYRAELCVSQTGGHIERLVNLCLDRGGGNGESVGA